MQILERPVPEEYEDGSLVSPYLSIVYTGNPATRAALVAAAQLAGDLGARIRVIVPRRVPYPLPLGRPPVSKRFDRERMQAFVNETAGDANVLICYCRDEVDALLCLLQSNSIGSSSVIVIGGRKRRWLPTKAQRIANKLEKAGHRVIFVDTGRNHA